MLYTVTIIGRPNVGKSTLFNAFLGRRQSIVSDIAGTTRDSLVEKVTDIGKVPFLLVDTAGLTNAKGDSLEDEIQLQAEVALEQSDLVLWIVDGKAPLTQDDRDIAEKLRRGKSPVLFIANKVDDGDPSKLSELYELGFGAPYTVSAKNNFGFWDLCETLEEKLLELGANEEKIPDDPDIIKLAFIGRPNVGKSSLFNALIGQKRSVVSDVAGTTRDAIDTEWQDPNGQKWRLIDTAGLRRKGKIGKLMEFWSSVRSENAIDRADVCVLLIDALDGVTHQDLALAGKIKDAGKGIIIGVNKFDLVKEKSQGEEETDEREVEGLTMWNERLDKIRDRYLHYLHQKIQFLPWAPVCFFSAKTGLNITDILESAKGIAAERVKRISTKELNLLVPEIYYGHVAPSRGTKFGKIKYASQVDTSPPKFLFFVNNVAAFHFSYRRYMENKLREKYGFTGTPIIVELRDAMKNFRHQEKLKKQED